MFKMNKSKSHPKIKDKIRTCIYCGAVADTKDHIPSKNLYREIDKNFNPIKIPSCKKCNSDLSKDEEYFRNVISSIQYENSISASTLFETAVKRSMQRKPSLGISIWKQMSLVDFYNPSGIYLGKKTAWELTEENYERIFRVLDKYIKGLFFHHFCETIPKDWIIKHVWLMPKNEEMLGKAAKEFKWVILNENIFLYGFNSFPKTHQSIWCLVFYGKPFFFSFVLDPKTAKDADRKYKK